MLRKVIKVQRVGKFTDFQAVGDLEFNRLNLIYAENGCGKTTFSHILRSLKTGDPEFIRERQTAGVKANPAISILMQRGKADFKDFSWNAQLSDLEIFDSTFVNENVYSGYIVETDHKRELYRFVIGEEGVILSQQVDDLDGEIRQINGEIRDLEDKIKCEIIGKLPADDFVSLPQREDIDDLISAKRDEIAALEQAKEITSASELTEIYLPEIPIESLRVILSRTLTDITAIATSNIAAHIEHCMDERGENWLQQGLQYIQEDICPFCGQVLTVDTLVKAYEVYFSAAYTQLKNDIAEFEDSISERLSETALIDIISAIKDNRTRAEFWGDFIRREYPEVSVDSLQNDWSNLKNDIAQHLFAKKQAPLEPSDFDAELSVSIEAFNLLNARLTTYNEQVRDVNALIQEKKRATGAGDLAEANKQLELLINTRSRFVTETSGICQQYLDAQQQKRDLDRQKKAKKKELDDFTKDLMKQYIEKLNHYLSLFGADFRIEGDEKPKYSGGKPSSNYRIVINEVTVELGSAKTKGEPSFKTLLSQGDKNTLAFAFFLTRLDLDPKLEEKVIVFDDPVSSLDNNRKKCTQQQASRIARKAKQVIVMSHDPHFLKMVWDDADRASTKTLHIVRSKQTSKLLEWDIAEAVQEEYFRDYFALQDYLRDGPEGKELRAVARCIRPLLEANLRLRFPEDFSREEWLGDFIGKVRDSKSGEPLYALSLQYEELDNINSYSKRYHHNQNPGADAEPITDGELRSYVQRTLNVISGILAVNPGT